MNCEHDISINFNMLRKKIALRIVHRAKKFISIKYFYTINTAASRSTFLHSKIGKIDF